MLYIGLDQSSKVVGYCVMDEEKILEYGVFNVPATKELMMRVSYILHFLEELIDKYSWKEVTVGLEDTQESKMNVNTFQLLTKVLGAIEYFLFNKNIPYKVCHISSWRKYAGVKGKKREDKKKHAIKIVEDKFEIQAEEDAAEAILICNYLRAQQDAW
jgi:Holliday junction resolvasome RuvABC endonuclease subunit